MNQPMLIALALCLVAGCGLGLFFYGGLWWTLEKLRKNPAKAHLLVFASFIIRTSASMAGIWFVTGGQWQKVLAVMVGFLLVRFVLTRKLGPNAISLPQPEGGGHGS
ncbi:ATP synthase subunit I [Salidesulfovibrio brasiliensis]|uniref:ATP synthase subunit I n=1 Tax=Salidesulfovibrio brasiliensis TaxID=221711 RepID=UPI0006D0CBED|nr:ATP synthase subunit I [Salidesulfovibrio brasiliensis]